jgi:hypothetical protein
MKSARPERRSDLDAVIALGTDPLLSAKQIAVIDGCALSTVLARMAKGEYGPIFKDGRLTRALLSGVKRRRETLKLAKLGKNPLPDNFKQAEAAA